jgi:hypothetical protein
MVLCSEEDGVLVVKHAQYQAGSSGRSERPAVIALGALAPKDQLS